ncbi:hypothetical protein CDV50_04905 [Haematobacter massiliensis]|uniref:phage portal protein n=1 Tax=Haematobacter massiliensis TaxID=195105 RepID=UPI000B4A47A9|nr:phage portal protein [Haematobacter massiliensis]OWJ72515.1 hypothetical protein CDV50_04905 [Haematobacter massiliensis]
MGLMQFFRRPLPSEGSTLSGETRAASGYTAQVIAARTNYITGASGLGELTAAVQTSVSLWESGLSLADVTGTDLLTPRALAITARALALRGESLWLIRDKLIPASDWDVTTRDSEPRGYRLSVPEAGGPRALTALPGEVLHFRIGSNVSAPWAGTSPLRRCTLSAELLHEVETALRDTFRDAPLGSQIVPLPDGATEDMALMRASFRGRRGATMVVEGVAQATAAGMNPQLNKTPDQLSPDLSRTLADKMLTEAKGAIYSVFGILPGLVNPATTGPMVREAQRHLAQLVLQPIAGVMAEEATDKLGGAVKVDVVRPMQAFDAGGKARALATMVQAMAQAKEAGIDGAALQDALSFIDWSD